MTRTAAEALDGLSTVISHETHVAPWLGWAFELEQRKDDMSLLTPNPQRSSPEHRLLMPAGVVKHLHVVARAVPDDATAGTESASAEIQALKDRVPSESIVLREEIDKTSIFEEIVGASPPLRAVLSHVAKVAPTDSTVLITGRPRHRQGANRPGHPHAPPPAPPAPSSP
jgi:hypothetical protein